MPHHERGTPYKRAHHAPGHTLHGAKEYTGPHCPRGHILHGVRQCTGAHYTCCTSYTGLTEHRTHCTLDTLYTGAQRTLRHTVHGAHHAQRHKGAHHAQGTAYIWPHPTQGHTINGATPYTGAHLTRYTTYSRPHYREAHHRSVHTIQGITSYMGHTVHGGIPYTEPHRTRGHNIHGAIHAQGQTIHTVHSWHTIQRGTQGHTKGAHCTQEHTI